MLSKVFSAATIGIEAKQIEIEVDIASGLPVVNIVGLPDTAIRESRDRVNSAIKNSQFKYPSRRITVNLAPCDLKKEGPWFDLPIAIGILTASEQLYCENIKDFVLLGELALNGRIRPVKGALPIAISLKNSSKKLIVPEENAYEAAVIKELEVYSAATLIDVCEFLKGEKALPRVSADRSQVPEITRGYELDFSDVKGQAYAKRAMEVAAAGGHNILMIGPPGSGKTMLAKRLPSILPEMSMEESLETTKIHSVAGLISRKNYLVNTRPFRAPHHTASNISMVGGGAMPKPGEVSLTHNGVLFMDELPEFNRNTLEALRQPLENKYVTVTRVNASIRFPSNFMLVCAMNPCKCGHYGDRKTPCRCTPNQIYSYRSKISGPLLDRIDIHIEVPRIEYRDLTSNTASEPSADIRKRVNKARSIQIKRFKNNNIFCNSSMSHRQINRFCEPEKKARDLLKMAMNELNLSARAYDKILKVSRTIADVEGSENIKADHISEAIQYRSLDRDVFF